MCFWHQAGTLRAMNPKETMTRYFETWNARDFDGFEALLADDMTFRGPLGTADGAREARRGIEGMSKIMESADVVRMVADGDDVLTWFELRTADHDPIAVANWAQVEQGKVRRVRVAFDPRPLLG